LKPTRLILFSSADFGFNLYWQSLTFFLLYFYTDMLGVPPGAAGAIMLAGALWDGIASLAVGVWLQRVPRYAVPMRLGALPLGIAFVALYLELPMRSVALLMSIVLLHLVFRTLYVVANIPYSALTARITADSRDRGWISALRMGFGAMAAICAALVTGRLTSNGAAGYVWAAALFAAIATLLIVTVGSSVRETAVPPARALPDASDAMLPALFGNRAFVSLALAAAMTALTGSTLGGSVLYYFALVVRSPADGATTIAWMTGVGAASIILWTLLRDRVGSRAVWLIACSLGIVACAVFALAGAEAIWPARVFLIVMQVALTGLSFVFWAMLPDTVEWGEWRTGRRLDGPVFGSAILIQRAGQGAGAALLGGLLQGASHAHAVNAVRVAMVFLPAAAMALSALAMLANPLRRHTHDVLVAGLRAGDNESGT
jgi:Na+/melibiose symporter-like transporter